MVEKRPELSVVALERKLAVVKRHLDALVCDGSRRAALLLEVRRLTERLEAAKRAAVAAGVDVEA